MQYKLHSSNAACASLAWAKYFFAQCMQSIPLYRAIIFFLYRS